MTEWDQNCTPGVGTSWESCDEPQGLCPSDAVPGPTAVVSTAGGYHFMEVVFGEDITWDGSYDGITLTVDGVELTPPADWDMGDAGTKATWLIVWLDGFAATPVVWAYTPGSGALVDSDGCEVQAVSVTGILG